MTEPCLAGLSTWSSQHNVLTAVCCMLTSLSLLQGLPNHHVPVLTAAVRCMLISSCRTTLINKKNDVAMPVGSVAWSGIVVDHERCHDCVHDKPGAYHDVKVNYQVIL